MGTATNPAVMPGNRPPSIALRAFLAVVLMVGFYLLAIAMAGALLWLCYAMLMYGRRIPVKVLLLCFIGAVVILWSLLPRFDRFVAPGPRLLPQKHPRLFKELELIAHAMGQQMPAEVYLEGDVNAWVAQRGGIMGFGSRRVMGLGLSLMRILNIRQFRAVLAHEFGHYHGGDTKLGPWVHKTRSAIGRTIISLGGGVLQKPFLWYGNMFLRVTHAVSRRQEFTADRLAATVVGREALTTGLQKVHGAALAFKSYWDVELVPVLSAGFRPPVAEGFARFMQCSRIALAVDTAVDKEMQEEQANPYDTHPPLRQRIAAVQDLPEQACPAEAPAAISLLEDVPGLERSLLSAVAGLEAVSKLSEARWEDTGSAVFIPIWRRLVRECSGVLSGVKPESLSEMVVPSLKARLGLSPPDEIERRNAAIAAALTLAAIDRGAVLECDLGMPVAVMRGSVRVQTFDVLADLASGKLNAAEWIEQCATLGIAGVELKSVASAAPAAN